MSSATPIELEIRQLLQRKASARQVLQILLPRLFESHSTPAEQKAIFALAWNSGVLVPLLEQVSELLRMGQTPPWPWLVEIWAKASTKACDPLVLDAVIKGATEQNRLFELAEATAWDQELPQLKELRRQALQKKLELQKNQRQQLLDKLAFFRNERMVEDEQRLLTLLKKLDPHDSHVEHLNNDFKERWARHVINRHAHGGEHLFERPQPRPDDSALEPAFRQWLKLSKDRPECIYDFSVALAMMNLDQWALEVLNTRKNRDSACDWLKAELLLRGQRHVEALDHLSQLELLYGQDPETSFAATYLRAQALWGLRQPAQAIELLQTLTQVRPQYRSALSLLKDWGAL